MTTIPTSIMNTKMYIHKNLDKLLKDDLAKQFIET